MCVWSLGVNGIQHMRVAARIAYLSRPKSSDAGRSVCVLPIVQIDDIRIGGISNHWDEQISNLISTRRPTCDRLGDLAHLVLHAVTVGSDGDQGMRRPNQALYLDRWNHKTWLRGDAYVRIRVMAPGSNADVSPGFLATTFLGEMWTT